MAERLEFDAAPTAPAAAGERKLEFDPVSNEQALRSQYGKEIAGRGEPGYGERFIDAATMGLTRPLSGVVRGVGGVFDPNSSFGERYRAGVGAASDYFKKGEENTAGPGGFATDIAGAVAAPPVGKLYTGGAGLLKAGRAALPAALGGAPAVAQTGGRELLGHMIGQGVTTGAIEGAARNAADVGSAATGAATGGALGGATAGAIGAAAKVLPAVRGAQKAVRTADQGTSPEELKAAAKPLFAQLDQNGIAYAGVQTQQLKQGLDDLIANNKYNPHANPTLKGYVDQLDQLATQPQGAKFTELSNIRSALAEQARGPDPSTRRAAGEIIGKIDDLVKNQPAVHPPGMDVAAVHKEARDLWKAASIADDVGYLSGKAERKAASKAGVNPDEANRGAFRPLLEKVEKPGAYSPFGDKTSEQRQLLARIVQGDKLQNTYRNLGAVAGSPVTRGALGLASTGLGITHGVGPLMGALGGGAAGGGAVKAMLDRAAANRGAANIDALLRNITGSQPKPIPPEALRALLAKQAAQRTGATYAGNLTGG
jgi:hypothetical protein